MSKFKSTKFIVTLILCAVALLTVTNIYLKQHRATQGTTPAMTTHTSPLIPRKVLFGNPDKANASLSPDGKYISYLAEKNNVLNIWLAPIDDLKNARAITNDSKRGILGYFWSYNSKHIIYTQDEDGDENQRLYSYEVTNGTNSLLTPAHKVKAQILKLSAKHPDHIIIGLNDRNEQFFDLYKLDLRTSERQLIFTNDKYAGFSIDNDLTLRFASLVNTEGAEEYFRLDEQGLWQPFMTVDNEDMMNTGIIGFDQTNTKIYLNDSRNRDTASLNLMDLANQSIEVIATDDKADVNPFLKHPITQQIQAVSIEYDRENIKVLDESIKADIEFLKSKDPGELMVLSRTLDDATWLISFIGDNSAPKCYIYDRAAKSLKFLFSYRKELENYQLTTMQPIVIDARDGLKLVNYLSLPAGIDTNNIKAPLPMVLLVHGGPWSRDSWGYNSQHQWLANRGYAVLSVNFRGSTGFGKNFINKGNKEWSRKMHDDLIDSVNWAVDKGIADKNKVVIMGGSYGGYAALVGLTFTPDFFAGAVDLVGPSSLMTLINSVPPYWKPILSDFKKRIGPWDTEQDKKFLDDCSPLTYVNNIKKPLLIAQGANDPRVKQSEADQIFKAMQDKHIPVAYALYPDEGHGFVKASNRMSFYALTERFLTKVLGGRHEEIGDNLKDTQLILNHQPIKTTKSAEHIIDEAIWGE